MQYDSNDLAREILGNSCDHRSSRGSRMCESRLFVLRTWNWLGYRNTYAVRLIQFAGLVDVLLEEGGRNP